MSDVIDLKAATPVSSSVKRYRRIVTDENDSGKSNIRTDEICPNTQAIMGIGEFATTELWKTSATPVDLKSEADDPSAGPVVLSPEGTGTTFRIVEFPPDAYVASKMPQRRPEELMHRTASIDYAYVIEGEVVAVMDEGETVMRAGDIMIQRGTNHNWSNRSDKPCRILFVLVGAQLPS
ncbi:cupin domain [Rhizobium sp. SJZ105]|uniref:cupin domain-containing protein n=1 Tax=Rhizobium sp. SJZ105 TaxID=2572678 RepID=UPI0011A6ABBF|nr:cupin domain-containing protein [Rhizobium sp. SJZ105]TWC76434.1 cupin domain [Rhizobium sp. SJZ105]